MRAFDDETGEGLTPRQWLLLSVGAESVSALYLRATITLRRISGLSWLYYNGFGDFVYALARYSRLAA
jgi:hypothetical protein